VITLAGVTIRRVCLPELADPLVHADYNETGAMLLTASAQHHDAVDLTARERAEILAVLLPGILTRPLGPESESRAHEHARGSSGSAGFLAGEK
jgi:hypothetical protein